MLQISIPSSEAGNQVLTLCEVKAEGTLYVPIPASPINFAATAQQSSESAGGSPERFVHVCYLSAQLDS